MRALRIAVVASAAVLLTAGSNPHLITNAGLGPTSGSFGVTYDPPYSCVRLQFTGSKELRVLTVRVDGPGELDVLIVFPGTEATFGFVNGYFRDNPLPGRPGEYTVELINLGSELHTFRVAAHDGHCDNGP